MRHLSALHFQYVSVSVPAVGLSIHTLDFKSRVCSAAVCEVSLYACYLQRLLFGCALMV